MGTDAVARVLLLEDDPTLARTLMRIFRSKGYDCTWAADGVQALELARSGNFDLGVFDWKVPGLDGFAVCARLRAARIHLPIIAISGHTEREHIAAAVKAGAMDFLGKRFHGDSLIERSEVVNARAKHQDVLEVGAITIIPSAQLVFADSDQVRAIDGIPYKLLRYMATHPNRLISRDQLARDVWDIPQDASNTIVVHISHLRKKLPKKAAAQIVTAGNCYALVDDPSTPPASLERLG